MPSPTSCMSSYSVTGDSGQAGSAERSNATSKRTRPDSEIDPTLLDLGRRAHERRHHILQKIKTLDRTVVPCFNGDIPFTNAVAQLSDPAFCSELPFPFVGVVPTRFKVDPNNVEKNWSYMGREKFTKLVEDFETMRKSPNHTALWVYGTRGYGKSHLLATFVCYLASQGKRVVYIPDCRECAKDSVEYFQIAMLFAWADDKNMQNEIMALSSMKEIYMFLRDHRDAILVVDQMNGLEILHEEPSKLKEKKGELVDYLERIRASHKSVLSTSANNITYRVMQQKQTSEAKMRLYGGLTTVSLNESNHRGIF